MGAATPATMVDAASSAKPEHVTVEDTAKKLAGALQDAAKSLGPGVIDELMVDVAQEMHPDSAPIATFVREVAGRSAKEAQTKNEDSKRAEATDSPSTNASAKSS